MTKNKTMRAGRPARESARAEVKATPRQLERLSRLRDRLRELARQAAEKEQKEREERDREWDRKQANRAPNVRAFYTWAESRPSGERWIRPSEVARICRVPEDVVIQVAKARGVYFDFGYDPRPIWKGRHIGDLRRIMVTRFDKHVRTLRRSQRPTAAPVRRAA